MAAPIDSQSLNKIQQRAIRAGLDLGRLPVHIGMIMDGNGRFAKRQGLARLWGHHQGYRSLRGALMACSEVGVRYLTVYAFSSENWARPSEEVQGLMQLIERSTRDELPTMMRNNVRFRVAGRIEELPPTLQEAFAKAEATTASNTGITFILAVNYGGRAEIVDAVKRILEEGLPAESITEQTLSDRLYLPDVPEPDMIIRTAGEMRWSNFLIYQGAYAELVVTQTTWPEFSPDTLIECLCEFQKRMRKFGGLSDTTETAAE